MTGRKVGERVLYYYGQKKLPLGSDLTKALQKWAELESGEPTPNTFKQAAERWEREYLKDKAKGTQQVYTIYLSSLIDAFGHFQLDQITPQYVRQYLDWRTAKISGNREIAVLSIIWNWSRERGLTNLANPCAGVKRFRERPRDRYVTQEEFDSVYTVAPRIVQDAMDLALLTSQREGDVLKLKRADIREGCLWFAQGKTGRKVRIRIEGRLNTVLERILGRSGAVQSLFIVSDDQGQQVRSYALQRAFRKAQKEAGTDYWQIRDLRAKAVSDEPNLKTASDRAGHADEKITATVYRRLKGNLVGPLN
jgi:integrase